MGGCPPHQSATAWWERDAQQRAVVGSWECFVSRTELALRLSRAHPDRKGLAVLRRPARRLETRDGTEYPHQTRPLRGDESMSMSNATRPRRTARSVRAPPPPCGFIILDNWLPRAPTAGRQIYPRYLPCAPGAEPFLEPAPKFRAFRMHFFHMLAPHSSNVTVGAVRSVTIGCPSVPRRPLSSVKSAEAEPRTAGRR